MPRMATLKESKVSEQNELGTQKPLIVSKEFKILKVFCKQIQEDINDWKKYYQIEVVIKNLPGEADFDEITFTGKKINLNQVLGLFSTKYTKFLTSVSSKEQNDIRHNNALGAQKPLPKELKGGSDMFNVKIGDAEIELQIYTGDLTKFRGDCIVSTTDQFITCDRGLARAIKIAGGVQLRKCIKEFSQHDPKGLRPTKIFETIGGELPCLYILHVLGGQSLQSLDMEKNVLHETVQNCLYHAHGKGLRSIGIPAIGIGGGAADEFINYAILTTLKAVEKFAKDFPQTTLKYICIVNIDRDTTRLFKSTWHENCASGKTSDKERLRSNEKIHAK